tara:strand:+ start:55 stop:1260 length:1206 start_codon:yes stop_codon:yes gene_type:complete
MEEMKLIQEVQTNETQEKRAAAKEERDDRKEIQEFNNRASTEQRAALNYMLKNNALEAAAIINLPEAEQQAALNEAHRRRDEMGNPEEFVDRDIVKARQQLKNIRGRWFETKPQETFETVQLEDGRMIQVNPLTGKEYTSPRNVDAGEEISVVQGEDGKVRINITKGVKTDQQKKLVMVETSLDALGDVMSEFQPKYQTLLFRGEQEWNDFSEKLNLNALDPTEKKELGAYKAWHMKASKLVNEEIKRITGSQMSEAEAKRIREGFPNVGAGLWPGDSPTAFMDKLKATIADLERVRARHRILLLQGQDVSAMTEKERDEFYDNEMPYLTRFNKDGTLRKPGDIPQVVMGETVDSIMDRDFNEAFDRFNKYSPEDQAWAVSEYMKSKYGFSGIPAFEGNQE